MKFLIALWKLFFGERDYLTEIEYIPRPPLPRPILIEPLPKAIPAVPLSQPLPPQPIPMPKNSMLITLCTAIRDFEGSPGDLNYRNNNPGNFRYSPVGYLAKYGVVRKDPSGFAIFPTYEQGWEYLQASILHWAYLHPTWSIRDLMYHYAPPADNNPTEAYAKNVAAHCGVPVETTLAKLLT